MKPILTFDLDGVLCRPPLGINPGRGQRKVRGAAGKRGLLWATERWRYGGRRPMPGAIAGFRLLAETWDCRILSARSEEARPATEAWLRRHLGEVAEINLRPDWHEAPAAYKARRVGELGALAHFEDDPHTASWVADVIGAVFLIDWWRNRWLNVPNVRRITRIEQAAGPLEALLGARR